MIDNGNDLFKGASQYYSKYRPMYPSSLIRFLVNQFDLKGKELIMDLGCGTGHLTIRLADWSCKIVGMDREPEMIEEARRIHSELRFGNIDWVKGNLESYKKEGQEKFNLVTIAKAFHWMDRSKTLDDLYDMVKDGGGVAIIDNYDPNKQPTIWQQALNDVISHWYGYERKSGNLTFSHLHSNLTESHEEIVGKSQFVMETHSLPSYELEWTIETILGNLYSTSYGSKRFLGNNVEAFERDVTEALLSIDETGKFKEQMETYVILGMKVRWG